MIDSTIFTCKTLYRRLMALAIILFAIYPLDPLVGRIYAKYSTGYRPLPHNHRSNYNESHIHFFDSFHTINGLYKCEEHIASPNDVKCSNIERIMIQRSHELARIAADKHSSSSSSSSMKHCSSERFVVITEIPWGNSGNNLIEFTHGLWVAELLNATFVVPSWIHNIFYPFNTSILESNFCYTLEDVKQGQNNKTFFEVTSEESFFIYMLYQRSDMLPVLPPWSFKTIVSLSKHFIRVYCALWAAPKRKIVTAGLTLISHKLGNNFRYTAIHKRGFEGGCSKVLGGLLPSWCFSPSEIPLKHPVWEGNLYAHHPICEMTAEFTDAVLHHNNRSIAPSSSSSSSKQSQSPTTYAEQNLRVFVAFDGAGDVTAYRQRGAVFSDELLQEEFLKAHIKQVSARLLILLILYYYAARFKAKQN